ncbi:MAG: hypothetical protein EPN40_12990 [Rhodanobacteraceae bacterium]|nr:MAG: hypothetical protein EPN40_12990 [Rhodanobacteraceae bacterium]
MRRHVVYGSLLLLGFGLLAGCGQKGPLFLPTKPATPASAAPASASAAPSAAKPARATTAAVPASATSNG